MDLNKNFEDEKFSFDMGKTILHFLAVEPYHAWYSKEIIKNQLRILQFLQSGKIDEEKVINDFSATLKKVSDLASKDYYSTLADISGDSQPDPS